jgi:hypothetical protein
MLEGLVTREDILQDLAYARSLAEEGRHAPLLGGAYLVFWGLLNAAAFAAHWAVLEGRLPYAGGAAFAAVWISYGVIAGIGMALLKQRIRQKPGLTSIGVRAEGAMWRGAAVAILAIVLGSLARMIVSDDNTAPNAIFGAAFALYGAALYGTACLSQQIWLKAFAWLSFAVAATLCLFANESWAYLTAALGSLLVLLAPGLMLMRREPSNIV